MLFTAMIYLLPTCRQKLKSHKPQRRMVRSWTNDAIETLRGAFECTLWSDLRDSCATLDEYTDVVTSYISFCESKCITTKTVTVYANDKPWFTRELKALLVKKTDAYKSGDRDLYKKAKYDVMRGLKQAKAQYRDKLQEKFSSCDSRTVWQGGQQITDYKRKSPAASDEANLADRLNIFYSRFDPQSTAHLQAGLPGDTPAPNRVNRYKLTHFKHGYSLAAPTGKLAYPP